MVTEGALKPSKQQQHARLFVNTQSNQHMFHRSVFRVLKTHFFVLNQNKSLGCLCVWNRRKRAGRFKGLRQCASVSLNI